MEKLIEDGKVSTVIVKDLSRFGRNYLDVSNYLEIKYPTLGVQFIAIQENVDTFKETGTEMMPFNNIFKKRYDSGRVNTQKALRQSIEKGNARIQEIDHLFEKIYEDATLGNLPKDRFQKMFASYEKQQKELIEDVSKSEKKLTELQKVQVDMRMLLAGLREFTEIKELTPVLVNKLIQRIEVHNNDKSSGHCFVQVDIYFTAVGLFNFPAAKEIEKIMEESKEELQEKRKTTACKSAAPKKGCT